MTNKEIASKLLKGSILFFEREMTREERLDCMEKVCEIINSLEILESNYFNNHISESCLAISLRIRQTGFIYTSYFPKDKKYDMNTICEFEFSDEKELNGDIITMDLLDDIFDFVASEDNKESLTTLIDNLRNKIKINNYLKEKYKERIK